MRISVGKVYERVGNLSFWFVKCPKGDNRRHFVAMKKTRKLPGFVTFAYLEDNAFTAVKREAKF